VRGSLIAAIVAGVMLASAAPAAPPEYPVRFIKVEELKALLDRNTRADIIDVRHWDSYVESHIRGARSIPLRALPDRAREISRSIAVVFY